MDDNNKIAEQHPSVVAELDELESLLLLMLTPGASEISMESRQHLVALAYRLTTTALDKARGDSAVQSS